MEDEEDGDAEWMLMLEGCAQEVAAEEEAGAEEAEVGIEADDALAGLDGEEEQADAVETMAEEAVAQEEETLAEEVEEAADPVLDAAAEELDNSEVLDAVAGEGTMTEADGETEAAQPLTGFIEIEDDGEEEEYEEYAEEQFEGEEAQQTEQADDAELAELEAAAVAQVEGAAGDSQAGAEFRDALQELPDGSPSQPKATVRATPKASAKASAAPATGSSARQPVARPAPAPGVAVAGEKRPAAPVTAVAGAGAFRRPVPPGGVPLLRVQRPAVVAPPGKGRVVAPPGTAKGNVQPRPAGVSWRPGVTAVGKGACIKGGARAVVPWGNSAGQLKGKALGAKGSAAVAVGYTRRVIVKGGKPVSKGLTKGVAKGVTKGMAKGRVAGSGATTAPWNSAGRTARSPDTAEPSDQAATTKAAGSSTANAPWNSTAAAVRSPGAANVARKSTASTTGASSAASGKRPQASATSGTGTATAFRAAKADGKNKAVVGSKKAPVADSKPASVAEKIKAVMAAKMKKGAAESDKAESKVKQSSPASVKERVAAAVAAGKRKGHDDAADSNGHWKAREESTAVPGKKRKTAQVGAVDAEGRQYDLEHVVVNFANVGAYFSKNVLKNEKDGFFDWEGIRRCVRHLTRELHLKVVGVLFQNFSAPDNGSRQRREMPDDIKKMCESIQETPRIQGQNHSSADDEMTIKCAYRRNCRFMDNDNYRDWKTQLRDEKCRLWLSRCQDLLQMRYYFDNTLGTFDTLDGNIPPGLLAPIDGKQARQVSKKELWTASRA